MEKYVVLASERSIVMPDMLDIEIGREQRLARVVRVPDNDAAPRVGDAFVLHTNRAGFPVAYEYGRNVFLVLPVSHRADAVRQLRRIAGVRRGSLDKIRLYIALRMAMKNQGVAPDLLASQNMLWLARHQVKSASDCVQGVDAQKKR